MLKFIDYLDTKNKQLTNLALLPGFNIEDVNSLKKHNIYKDSSFTFDNMRDKNVISDKMFANFFKIITSFDKTRTKKRRTREQKSTRKI